MHSSVPASTESRSSPNPGPSRSASRGLHCLGTNSGASGPGINRSRPSDSASWRSLGGSLGGLEFYPAWLAEVVQAGRVSTDGDEHLFVRSQSVAFAGTAPALPV